MILSFICNGLTSQTTQSTAENSNPSGTSTGLEDEREVAEQSLRVCESARAYIERLSNAEQKPSQSGFEVNSLEVQLRPRQGLDENRVGFAETIGCPRKSLELAVTSGISGLEVHEAGEVIAKDGSDQILVTTLGDPFDMKKASCTGTSVWPVDSMTRRVIASGNSNQVVVNSRPGCFDITKATSTGTSAQLVASTTGDILSVRTAHSTLGFP